MLADHAALAGCRASVARVSLRLAAAGRGPAVSVAIPAWVKLALALRRVGSIGVPGAAQLVFAALARAAFIGVQGFARGVVIVKALRRVRIASARSISGPGESVGEVVYPLPGALAGFPLPDGFIGRKLAALAVARGEAASVQGNALLVGGRVVIEPGGAGVFVAVGGEAKALRALALEAGHIGEGVVMAAGPVRDAWLSEQRNAAAVYVRKNAKAAAKIDDAQKRAAALADLRFMELKV